MAFWLTGRPHHPLSLEVEAVSCDDHGRKRTQWGSWTVGENSSLVLNYLGRITDLKSRTVCRSDKGGKGVAARRAGFPSALAEPPPSHAVVSPSPLPSLDSAAQDVFGRDARRPPVS